jgi:Flp pilus assembly protein TadG
MYDNEWRNAMKRLRNLCGHVMALRHGFCRPAAPGRACAQFRSGSRLRAHLRSSSEGQSLVEFAFVVPILMAIMMGIYAVGIITFNEVALNNAVDLGSTYLMRAGPAPGTNMTSYLADPCQYAFAQMTSATSNLLPQNLTVTYKLNGKTIGPFTGAAANSCSSNSTDFAAGGNFTLIATYPCTLGLYGFNVPGCKLKATASQFIYTS